jgi:hypothetical protein
MAFSLQFKQASPGAAGVVMDPEYDTEYVKGEEHATSTDPGSHRF